MHRVKKPCYNLTSGQKHHCRGRQRKKKQSQNGNSRNHFDSRNAKLQSSAFREEKKLSPRREKLRSAITSALLGTKNKTEVNKNPNRYAKFCVQL